MENNEDLAVGQLHANFTFKEMQAKWMQIAQKLNEIGPERDGERWKKTWQDLRSDAKKHAGELLTSTLKTGGGEGVPYHLLSPNKQRILAISGGRTAIEGHHEVPEFGITIRAAQAAEDAETPTVRSSSTETPTPTPSAHPAKVPIKRALPRNVLFSETEVSPIAGTSSAMQPALVKPVTLPINSQLPTLVKHAKLTAPVKSQVSTVPATNAKLKKEIQASIPVTQQTPKQKNTKTKSDEVMSLHQNEIDIFSNINENLSVLVGASDRSANALERIADALERSSSAQYETGKALKELVNFVLKKSKP